MTTRQTYTLDEIKDELIRQLPDVAYRYAPEAKGSYVDKGLYFTLNPGRVDKSVGSFWVHLTGSKAGRWQDMATGQFGDILDLIQLYQGGSITDAIKEARSYLGLDIDDPEIKRKREEAAKRSKARREEAARQDAKRADGTRRAAHALWLSGEPKIAGTPVEFYLRDQRGIDLAQLGRAPGSLRFIPSLNYDHHDADGVAVEGEFPAMVAIVTDAGGNAVACHRTWLAIDDNGRWNKAPVPAPKKVLGRFGGGLIHIWKGTGPRGGKACRLAEAPQGTHVYIAEGIEDALSGVMLLPQARFVAAISLGNLGRVALPEAVTAVTLIADQDEGPQAQKALQAAIAQHQKAGRTVRLWQNSAGGKDLNDALRAAQQQEAS